MPLLHSDDGATVFVEIGKPAPWTSSGSWKDESGSIYLPFQTVQVGGYTVPANTGGGSGRAVACILFGLMVGFATGLGQVLVSNSPSIELAIVAGFIASLVLYLLIVSPRWFKLTLLSGVSVCILAVFLPVYDGHTVAQMIFGNARQLPVRATPPMRVKGNDAVPPGAKTQKRHQVRTPLPSQLTQ